MVFDVGISLHGDMTQVLSSDFKGCIRDVIFCVFCSTCSNTSIPAHLVIVSTLLMIIDQT